MNCSHCGQPVRGSAGLTLNGVHYALCHPDEGVDCYRLVTVYNHPFKDCLCDRVLANRLTSEAIEKECE